MSGESSQREAWQPTACILCSRNCGLEVQVEGGHLEVPEMLAALDGLRGESEPAGGGEFPLVLIAGERRSWNANQILRDPEWRRADPVAAHCDPLTATPFHKHVRVRVRPAEPAAGGPAA